MRIWQSVATLLGGYGKCAMVTIIAVKGSSPREEGARMLVVEGGGYRGTIGGGALEWRAIADAQALLCGKSRSASIFSIVLGPDVGQCCGGQVRLLVETFTVAERRLVDEFAEAEVQGGFSTELDINSRALERKKVNWSEDAKPSVRWDGAGMLLEHFSESSRPVYLFGAGHVGRALVLAMAPLPFTMTWIDSRPGSFPGAVPPNTRQQLSLDPAGELDKAPEGSFVLVMTHSHALDLDITLRALRSERFPYIGVIGSRTKRARFVSRLRSVGMDERVLSSFVCPIGSSGIRSKLPAVIAAATVTELILRDEELSSAGERRFMERRAG